MADGESPVIQRHTLCEQCESFVRVLTVVEINLPSNLEMKQTGSGGALLSDEEIRRARCSSCIISF